MKNYLGVVLFAAAIAVGLALVVLEAVQAVTEVGQTLSAVRECTQC